ncbi:integral membrane protein S linking to the trans Golgi network-domain-containing protein [Cladochytrium replicatum]|nr:integral membrane protein S linking to the trans Golgi network-domain-containing protein [Cladochytrium replicatum]
MSTTFRSSDFDPILVASQIAFVQTAGYVSGSLIILLVELLMGSPIRLNHLLAFTEVRLDTVFGWCILGANILNSSILAFVLLIVVQRSKLCLDFACTQHFIHLIVTSTYSGRIPNTLVWWLQTGLTLAIMALGGEYLCMRKELEPVRHIFGYNSATTDLPCSQINLTSQRKRDEPNHSFEMERLNVPDP